MKSMWNGVNPYVGYANNPFAAQSYFPFMGMNQPTLGSQFLMNMGGRNAMSTPNPLAYNYPKVPNFSGTQYSAYPKFRQYDYNSGSKSSLHKQINAIQEKEGSSTSKKTEELADKLKEEILKLEEITNKAKEMASHQQSKTDNNEDGVDKSNDNNTSISGHKEALAKDITKGNLRKENSDGTNIELPDNSFSKLNELTVSKEDRERFDEHMKEMMNKLSSLK
eukprot:CAMPEP_0170517146 /NCGR_PEP_ID=MMETSP0209-20121228/3212_1 /TAXON_ID=665100 ORGANISM="Litonotus pictus, Strain P1" /NCGR_SAMPLE_ID=MMETSP0209 /ASSEMBLY_ACC=CAM_ASM_000301 /LENGTH=221 /DNA_ID=CAMNT_0010802311 /DNA_START=107 /DNA_END=772 /DNA_ORIENTATION=+